MAGPEDAGQRLDLLVTERVGALSRSMTRRLIDEERILVNGISAKASRAINVGDSIAVELALPPSLSAVGEDVAFEVVYQDRDLAVIEKPAGLVIHPAAGHESGTLVNGLVARFPQIKGAGDTVRPGIVHRLDKDTSGLLVVALNAEAQFALQNQIVRRSMERRYLALATGHVEPTRATIRAPIGRDPTDRKRMAIFGINPRAAETSYSVLETLPGFTLLEAKLHTGRTHQIRVHFSAVGHPIAGDSTYHGGAIPGLARQFLHAYQLALDSPSTGQRLNFLSTLPMDLRLVLKELGVTIPRDYAQSEI